jgi:TolA-binding protein
MPVMSQNEQLFQIAGDLLFRNMDFPGAETIADRLAANNPLAQINTKSDIPPQVQMQLAQSQQQIQMMQQAIQQLQMTIKTRQDIEQVKQDNENKREIMKQSAKVHDINLRDAERRHDTQLRTDTAAHDTVIKTQTQIELEHIKGQFALMLAHLDQKARNEAAEQTAERAI